MFNKNLILSILILLILYIPVFGNIEEARNLYNLGNYKDAFLLYSEWLENNSGSEDVFTILKEISSKKGNIDDIVQILSKYTEYLGNIEEKKLILIKIAEIYSLNGSLEKAQKSYFEASLVNLEQIDYKNLLNSAKLLILQGDVLSAEAQLKEIITKADDEVIISSARLYYRILFILDSRDYSDRSVLKVNTPDYTYLIYLTAKAESDNSSMEILKNYLQKNYPLSPENFLLNGQIKLYPNIISSLGLLNRKIAENYPSAVEKPENDEISLNYMVQAGSFKDAENAEYLAVDLSTRGFSPVVEEQLINGTTYYKVLLYFNTQTESREALLKLKKAGFEGFPVY